MNGVNLTDFGFDFLQPFDLEEKKPSTVEDDFWTEEVSADVTTSAEPDEIAPDHTEQPQAQLVDVDPTIPANTVKRVKIPRKTTKKAADKKRKPGKPGRPKKKPGKYEVARPLKYKRPENGYATYEECRAFILSFGFKSVSEMNKYIHDNAIPPEIPVRIKTHYNIEDMRVFLNLPPRNEGVLLSYEEARKLIQSAGVTKHSEYQKFRETYNKGRVKGKLPHDLYARYPDKMDVRDFFGTKKLTSSERSVNLYNFADARAFVRTLGLTSVEQWNEYTKSPSFPMYLPKKPERSYIEFSGYKNWLGYDRAIENLLDNVQRTDVVLGVFNDPYDDMYVYQVYAGGYPAIVEFVNETGYKLVRAYKFNMDNKKQWTRLVESHASYHEMNMFTTFNIHGLLFDADGLYAIATP